MHSARCFLTNALFLSLHFSETLTTFSTLSMEIVMCSTQAGTAQLTVSHITQGEGMVRSSLCFACSVILGASILMLFHYWIYGSRVKSF